MAGMTRYGITMRLFFKLLLILCLCTPAYAQTIRIRQESQHPLRHKIAKALLNCQLLDNYCFVYDGTVLKLYVTGILQAQWADE